MTNRFKDPTLRTCYATAVAAYKEKRPVLFHNGTPYVGNSIASFFCKGFRGSKLNWGGCKQTLMYAYYRAGQDCAKEART